MNQNPTSGNLRPTPESTDVGSYWRDLKVPPHTIILEMLDEIRSNRGLNPLPVAPESASNALTEALVRQEVEQLYNQFRQEAITVLNDGIIVPTSSLSETPKDNFSSDSGESPSLDRISSSLEVLHAALEREPSYRNFIQGIVQHSQESDGTVNQETFLAGICGKLGSVAGGILYQREQDTEGNSRQEITALFRIGFGTSEETRLERHQALTEFSTAQAAFATAITAIQQDMNQLIYNDELRRTNPEQYVTQLNELRGVLASRALQFATDSWAILGNTDDPVLKGLFERVVAVAEPSSTTDPGIIQEMMMLFGGFTTIDAMLFHTAREHPDNHHVQAFVPHGVTSSGDIMSQDGIIRSTAPLASLILSLTDQNTTS